ncbi:MAG: hypothetical protein J7J93_02770 [Candidatus Aenigmarchaeota archaeon]|nr:hypothetical protein [Candidatus Aenigmarchaeota archaeon]
MKIKFLDIMFAILALIGLALIILSVWFSLSIKENDIENIGFRINLLTFLTGTLYILFVYTISKIIKKK